MKSTSSGEGGVDPPWGSPPFPSQTAPPGGLSESFDKETTLPEREPSQSPVRKEYRLHNKKGRLNEKWNPLEQKRRSDSRKIPRINKLNSLASGNSKCGSVPVLVARLVSSLFCKQLLIPVYSVLQTFFESKTRFPI